MTFREVINEVLVRLREDTIDSDWTGALNDATTVTDYQKLIGAFVNDSRKSVESYHDWSSARRTLDISPLFSSTSFSLISGSVKYGQDTKILSIYNEDTGTELKQVSKDFINDKTYPGPVEVGEPRYYYIKGTAIGYSSEPAFLNIGLYPKTPATATNLKVDVIAYMSQLTSAGKQIHIPNQPIILGAWARAIAERGEDGGTQSAIAAQEASESLKKAVMLDRSNVDYETDWYVA